MKSYNEALKILKKSAKQISSEVIRSVNSLNRILFIKYLYTK